MKYLLTIVCVLVVLCGHVWADEVMNNATVVDLNKAGLGEALIISKIQQTKCEFDISAAALIKLKEGGLSDQIISAMIERVNSTTAKSKPKAPQVTTVSHDPTVIHEPGLWLYVEQGTDRQMVKLKAQDCGRSSGWNKKSRAVLLGASSITQISTPTFAFYFYEKPQEQTSDLVTTTLPNAVADDFVLTKMEVRADKNERRLAVGKEEFFGGKKSGLDGRDVVQTKVEMIGERIYRITPTEPLKPGEYAFIDHHQANRESLKSGVVDLYDFGIKK